MYNCESEKLLRLGISEWIPFWIFVSAAICRNLATWAPHKDTCNCIATMLCLHWTLTCASQLCLESSVPTPCLLAVLSSTTQAQKGFVCRCAACALVDDTYRRISYAGTTLSKRENGLWGPLLNAVGTMYTDNDLWLDVLHREGVLAAKAAKLAHAGADAGNAGRMSAARYEQVRADLQESLAVLGPDHFATQCFRRTVLMQKRAVCMELSPDERTALELHARICGEYLERCSQYLEVQTSALYVMLPSAALC
eukprot:m.750932 g.750932  ORF g.750932 m.750932 type:complete len:253 (+) comp23163_c0_seq4:770-1528(+)